MKPELQKLLWCAGGFALGVFLAATYELVNHVNIAVAFGLLCFGCGLVLFLYLNLRWREEELDKSSKESMDRWLREFADLEKQREDFRSEKEEWENAREN